MHGGQVSNTGIDPAAVALERGIDAPPPSPRPAADASEAGEVWQRDDVVLVQDWIGNLGGAEMVLRELASLFPRAPILTLFAMPDTVRHLGIDPGRVRQSYLGRLPSPNRLRKLLVPWFADAVQTLDVGDAALIVSSSHVVAKSVPHRSYQRHIAYMHTPARYAHDLMPEYLKQVPALLRPWMRRVLRDLAIWDVATANRVTRYVANSRAVAERIWRLYRRRASVIHPPVDVASIPCRTAATGDYYIALSRLVAQKRIDVAVRTAARLQRRLVVLGEGPERRKLEELARAEGATHLVEFMGRVPDAEKYQLLGGARALLFPGEEDFGIVGVEALAAGTPVIAHGRAGMLDVVGARYRPLLSGPPCRAPGGVLFAQQSAEGMMAAVAAFEEGPARAPAALRELALRFSVARFRRRFLGMAHRTMDDECGPSDANLGAP
jgi:glycosyltransferase involved in cell wall biosynthesis